MSAEAHGGPLPKWLVATALVAAAGTVLPLIGLASRVDWPRLIETWSSPSAASAMGLSLRTSAVATVIVVACGVPLGLVLARITGPLRRVLRALILAPLVLPPVVSGLGLLYVFGRRGLLGSTLEVVGVRVGYSTIAVVIAQAFVSMPFVVAAIEAAVTHRMERTTRIAAGLGASPTRVFASVTLPFLRSAIAAGGVLAFARSLGEFGATLTFAGSREGVTRTGPLLIYMARESDPQAAVAIGLLLLALSLIIVGVVLPLPRKADG